MKFLEKICELKKEEVEECKRKLPIEAIKNFDYEVRDFISGINKPGRISIIAEMKKASPSAGLLREDYDPKEIGKKFELGGASAISVLTENNYFHGNIFDIGIVKRNTSRPVLRKDFIIDSYQIYESRYYGADSVLLISAILGDYQLQEFFYLAKELNLLPLVEIHSEDELKKVLELHVDVIGINNRNLETLDVDIDVTFRLKPLIPGDKLVVSESGIRGRGDIESLRKIGINSVLIGEHLMKSNDIVATLSGLIQ